MMRSHLMKPACGVKISGGWIKFMGCFNDFFFDMRFKCSAVTPMLKMHPQPPTPHSRLKPTFTTPL
jgi:hypothetical protein